MLELVKYTGRYKNQWDNLISESRNGSFLFYRNYMDYHSERFIDCSYLIFKKGKVEAVLPGNISNNRFYSHEGLTYGGLVISTKISISDVIEIFKLLNEKLKKNGIQEIIYKPVPLIYHKIPAQEDIYALFLLKAKKIGCNLSSTIFQNNRLPFIESRKSGIRKSIREGVEVSESHNFSEFWEILDNNLTGKYKVKPVHTIREIRFLRSQFPNNIKLYVAKHNRRIVAGTVLYVMKNIIHVQYIASSQTGKEVGSLDAIFNKLIEGDFQNIPIFDFGQSTERMGHYLNENLIFQKEGFGGRGIVYDIYKYNIAKSK